MNSIINNRKYKVVYYHRKNILEKIALSLIPSITAFGLNLAVNNFEIYLEKELNYNFIYLTFLTPISWVYFIYNSRISPNRNKRIQRILYNVIKSNNFFKSEDYGYYQKVYTSLTFTFYKTDNVLIINADSHGASYTKQSYDLGKILESALDLPLLNVNDFAPGYVTYEFSLKNVKPLSISHLIDLPSNKGCIQLDTEKAWYYDSSPHALVAGATGSGKTYMLFYLILQHARLGAEIYILDPKRSDLHSLIQFIPLGHNHVAMTANQICSVLRKVNEEMNFRYEKYFSNTTKMGVNYKYFNLQQIVIYFDEVAAFMEEDKKLAKEAEGYLKQLLFKGRQAGIQVILSTQKPTAEAIPTAIRDQMGLRIALGNMSRDGYKMALGDSWDELPSAEVGQAKGFIMIDGMGWTTPRPFKAPVMNLDELKYHDTLAKLLEEGVEKYKQVE